MTIGAKWAGLFHVVSNLYHPSIWSFENTSISQKCPNIVFSYLHQKVEDNVKHLICDIHGTNISCFSFVAQFETSYLVNLVHWSEDRKIDFAPFCPAVGGICAAQHMNQAIVIMANCWFTLSRRVPLHLHSSETIRRFLSHGGTPIAGWLMMETPITMDEKWGYPPF